jgi:hypothetical protein
VAVTDVGICGIPPIKWPVNGENDDKPWDLGIPDTQFLDKPWCSGRPRDLSRKFKVRSGFLSKAFSASVPTNFLPQHPTMIRNDKKSCSQPSQ